MDNGEEKLRTDLFRKKRIKFKRLRSQKGASVVFAIVGFMFAAMISIVVINAAYSAANRLKKLKYDEQSILLAQSMSGIITEALSGDGSSVKLPDDSEVKLAGKELKNDGLTVSYQYIESKDSTGAIAKFYNDAENGGSFAKNATLKTFYTTVKGKDPDTLTNSVKTVQTLILHMARMIDQGGTSASETIETTKDLSGGETCIVTTVFTMDKSYLLTAVTTATVSKGAISSSYAVRIDASAAVRTDKLVCAGTKSGDTITISDFKDKYASGTEELVKVSCFSVTWPPDQARSSVSN